MQKSNKQTLSLHYVRMQSRVAHATPATVSHSFLIDFSTTYLDKRHASILIAVRNQEQHRVK